MAILTITSRKGGCGKTTVATALAAALVAEGVDVALLDADANGSAHRWASSTHEGPPIASYAEADAERLADPLPAWSNGMRCCCAIPPALPTRPQPSASRRPMPC